MITISLMGGLGNQLFQLAALETISKETQHSSYLQSNQTPTTHHSSKNYFETILLEWRALFLEGVPITHSMDETSYVYQKWKLLPGNTSLRGYFQNYRYVSDTFLRSLWLPNVPILNGAFLHIRGGDYVNNPFHDVGLTAYYERAIAQFPSDTMFYVFTNDISYTKTLSFLNKIQYTRIDETDEVRALALMKNCSVGGICANSTFSWWGAYLNRVNRTLVLPNKWFNDPNIYVEGYFFPGSITCPV